jgi:hypothetical protein
MVTTVVVILGLTIPVPKPTTDPVRLAIEAAIPKLVAGAEGHIKQKSCFACHNQASPVLALRLARERGFTVPKNFFEKQAEHITDFLASHTERFLKGEGTGGQADTAGYALFTLELTGHQPDASTAAVVDYLLNFRNTEDHWRTSSNRPPSEASSFSTTYVALRGLRSYGGKSIEQQLQKRVMAVRAWLIKAEAKDTEDRVFRLLALNEAGADPKAIAAAAWDLMRTQRPDGGWSQLDGRDSDAYATGTALFALHTVGGLSVRSPAYQAGVKFLVKSQLPDGTWKVPSRSKPFQPYYESGFPHGKDQFISIAASGWATAALVLSLGND